MSLQVVSAGHLCSGETCHAWSSEAPAGPPVVHTNERHTAISVPPKKSTSSSLDPLHHSALPPTFPSQPSSSLGIAPSVQQH